MVVLQVGILQFQTVWKNSLHAEVFSGDMSAKE